MRLLTAGTCCWLAALNFLVGCTVPKAAIQPLHVVPPPSEPFAVNRYLYARSWLFGSRPVVQFCGAQGLSADAIDAAGRAIGAGRVQVTDECGPIAIALPDTLRPLSFTHSGEMGVITAVAGGLGLPSWHELAEITYFGPVSLEVRFDRPLEDRWRLTNRDPGAPVGVAGHNLILDYLTTRALLTRRRPTVVLCGEWMPSRMRESLREWVTSRDIAAAVVVDPTCQIPQASQQDTAVATLRIRHIDIRDIKSAVLADRWIAGRAPIREWRETFSSLLNGSAVFRMDSIRIHPRE